MQTQAGSIRKLNPIKVGDCRDLGADFYSDFNAAFVGHIYNRIPEKT